MAHGCCVCTVWTHPPLLPLPSIASPHPTTHLPTPHPTPTPPQARMECQSYRLTVEDAPSTEYIARHIGQMQQKYTQRGGVRPFGTSTLIGGVGPDGVPQLWNTDPSGVYSSWKANAVGRSAKALLELLEKQYKDGCSEEEGTKLAVRALLEVVESGARSIEIGVLRKGQRLEMVSEERITALVEAIEKEKAAAEAAGGGAAAGGSGGAAS